MALKSEWQQCRKKHRYETRAQAKRQAKIQRRNYGSPKLYVYYCDAWCGGWHLTKKPQGDNNA